MIACVCVYAPTVNAVQHVVSTVSQRHHNGFYIINVPSKTLQGTCVPTTTNGPIKGVSPFHKGNYRGTNDIAHNPCRGAQTNKLLIQRRAPSPWGHTATAVLDVTSYVSVDPGVDPTFPAVKPIGHSWSCPHGLSWYCPHGHSWSRPHGHSWSCPHGHSWSCPHGHSWSFPHGLNVDLTFGHAPEDIARLLRIIWMLST